MGHDAAILAVSFGTTHMDTLERSIAALERAIAETFPEYPVYRAFLSPTVIRRLRERHGMETDNVAQALERIEADGWKHVVIQPTLLLGGLEYGLLFREAKKTGLSVAIGRPLLETREDCEALASIIIEENPLKEKEALVLMGHGTEHVANEVYSVMQEIFIGREYPCFIDTVDGASSSADVVDGLIRSGTERAKLLPLMFVAGKHVKKDMAGEGESLLTKVREAGILAEAVFRGLGESRSVRQIYVNRVREALAEAAGKNTGPDSARTIRKGSYPISHQKIT